MNAIEIRNLCKNFGQKQAVCGLNMTVPKGAIYGFIGENGSGKSTTEKMICGLIHPTSGTILINGKPHTDIDERSKMSSLIESPGCFPNCSVWNNLMLQATNLSITNKEDAVRKVLTLVRMEGAAGNKYKNCSLGMKQRIGIAMALLGDPELLILDEPINGLDPQGIIEIRELILKLNKERRITILISSHYLDELSKIATHYGFLDNGSIIKEISSEELMRKMEHKIELKVSNQKDFVKYFEENKLSYEAIDNKTINVYGKYNLSKFINELSKKNLIADEIHEQEESLENYYMNLIGGGKND